MGSSPGFGSTPCHLCALLRLAFAPPLRHHPLKHATRCNSPAHSSISTRSALRPLTACRRTVSGSFHSPAGVLFTFPSRYSFTIGRQEYLALEGGPPCFPRDSTCPAVLKRNPTRSSSFVYGALTPSGPGRPPGSTRPLRAVCGIWGLRWTGFQPPLHNAPRLACSGFGLRRVRSPLLA